MRLGRVPCAICGGKKWQVNGTPGEYYCERCLSEIFPFCSITNDRDFKEAINGFSIEKRHLDKASKLKFNPLDDEIKETLEDL